MNINFYQWVRKLYKSNNQILAKNIIGSFSIKGLAMIISLFTMPAYMNYFSNQIVLGIWFTLLSLLNWILNFDLGIGNGLRNNLVISFSSNDFDKSKKLISSAYIILGVLSLFVGVIGYYIISIIDWNNFLKIEQVIITDKILIKSIRILFIGIVIQFYLKLIYSIFYAMQKTILPSFLSLISTSSLILFMTFYSSNNNSHNLLILSYVNVIAVNLPLFVITIVLFCTKLKKSIPSINCYVHDYAKDIVSLGGAFFVIQITFMIITSTNQILITLFYNPQFVVEYQVYYKIFHLFVTLFSLITNPIWSAVSQAFAEKRIKWIIKLFQSLLKVVVFMFIIIIIFIPFFQSIVDIWLNENSLKISSKITILFGVDTILMIMILAITSISNGINNLRPQFICNIAIASLKIPLIYFLSLYSKSWSGIILANILLLIPAVVYQLIDIKKVLMKIE